MVILVDLKSCTQTTFLQIKLVTITKNRSIWSSDIYFRFMYIFIKIKYFIGSFGVKYRWTFLRVLPYTKNINIDGYTAFTSHFTTIGDNLTVSNGGTGWKSVLCQSLKHTAELKLSRPLRKCSMLDNFPDFSLAFFRKWNFGATQSESNHRRTKRRFVIMVRVAIYITITWAETKLPICAVAASLVRCNRTEPSKGFSIC